jgi:HEAT repeat protein
MSKIDLLDWLKGGTLRSDGAADQVADAVLIELVLFKNLLEGLKSEDDVVRGRTADAMEKVAREYPNHAAKYLDEILAVTADETLPMANWHLAMLYGYIAAEKGTVEKTFSVLMRMLADASAFVKSWAITSLCIIARLHPQYFEEITREIGRLSGHESAAVRTRVRYALETLMNPKSPFPKTWIKSPHVQKLIE